MPNWVFLLGLGDESYRVHVLRLLIAIITDLCLLNFVSTHCFLFLMTQFHRFCFQVQFQQSKACQQVPNSEHLHKPHPSSVVLKCIPQPLIHNLEQNTDVLCEHFLELCVRHNTHKQGETLQHVVQ